MLLCADVWALAGQFGNQAGGGGGALCVGTELTERWGGGWKSRGTMKGRRVPELALKGMKGQAPQGGCGWCAHECGRPLAHVGWLARSKKGGPRQGRHAGKRRKGQGKESGLGSMQRKQAGRGSMSRWEGDGKGVGLRKQH